LVGLEGIEQAEAGIELRAVAHHRARTHAARPVRESGTGDQLPAVEQAVCRQHAELEVEAGAGVVAGNAVVVVVELGIAPGERGVRPPAESSIPELLVAVAEPQLGAIRLVAHVAHRLAVHHAGAELPLAANPEVVAGKALALAEHAFGHVVGGEALEAPAQENLGAPRLLVEELHADAVRLQVEVTAVVKEVGPEVRALVRALVRRIRRALEAQHHADRRFARSGYSVEHLAGRMSTANG